MSTQRKARIRGMGSYVPEKILSNKDLEKLVETNDEWIVSRTGMRERRVAAKDEAASDMGTIAAKRALEKSGLTAQDMDLILVATMCPDHATPSTATLIQAKIGATEIPGMDLGAACSGFLYALSVAKTYVEAGVYKNVLVIASEKMTAYTDYQDRGTCILFGDGAGAAVVGVEGRGLAIDSISLGADGSLAKLIVVPAGGSRLPTSKETVAERQHYVQMEGRQVFKHAVRRMEAAARGCLEDMNLTDDAISWFVPHQANIRIIDAMAKRFSIPEEKVYKTLHKYGNTSASSIGIALDELLHEHKVDAGERILLVAFGAGLTWAASLLTMLGDEEA